MSAERPETADYRCTNGHDLCYGGTSAGPDCPYCERVAPNPVTLRSAGFYLQVGNLKISLCDDPAAIAIDRDGEGGHFSLKEFHDVVQQFVSDRL